MVVQSCMVAVSNAYAQSVGSVIRARYSTTMMRTHSVCMPVCILNDVTTLQCIVLIDPLYMSCHSGGFANLYLIWYHAVLYAMHVVNL
jgi:hypothetical protein